MTKQPIIVEFIAPHNQHKEKHYFIGASLDDVLDDTNQGTEFGFIKFSSYTLLPLDEAKKLGLGYYDAGYKAITSRQCLSFKLKTPEK